MKALLEHKAEGHPENEGFWRFQGRPQFLHNCVEDQNVGRDIIVHRVRRNIKNKKDMPTAGPIGPVDWNVVEVKLDQHSGSKAESLRPLTQFLEARLWLKLLLLMQLQGSTSFNLLATGYHLIYVIN
ncbi:uncharacterized protein [Spinacia oleracea]|uniref:Uncharacterized protein n=1 Tax=Spinacia oleracea TaxID=3562 RepID=A0ABM3QGX2_SPIOL|nr:uncharacterized protein LOC110798401 [Spinacia oleracea]XP_056682611.1 uncharacterized protein LOC110798401 [Spinacia oleracea]XP_056682612.1 uncharacterized protein LOC110798401 [Spinacia oleracea]XP_056691385.1 uncharacterized protein LOC110789041 [Spinacia oleracea]XP_056691386.1 uncharacterized protein LOC110789041 [Spinacia oleracea]